MSERGFLAWPLVGLVIASCGPEVDPPPSDSTTSGSTSSMSGISTTSSASSTSSTGSDVESGGSSSSSGSGIDSSSVSDSGGPANCEDWEFPARPYGWSLQDCLTDPCPDGEVCRYDPYAGDCGTRPVCVNPTTLQCACEIYGPESGGLACPCPGYDGPLNSEDQVILECNTFMSPGPVTSNQYAHCII